MPDITIEAIANTVQTIVKQELEPVTTRLTAIEVTLGVHTKALDRLLKDLKDREDNNTLVSNRFDRLEKWAKLVGEKVGLKLEL